MQYHCLNKEKNTAYSGSCSKFINSKWFNPLVVVMVFLGLFMSSSVFAADLLKGSMSMVKENFGTDSTVVRLIYLADILLSVVTFIKTKNFVATGSVLFTLIFLTYTLNNIAFKGV